MKDMGVADYEFQMKKAEILQLQTKLKILQELHSMMSELLKEEKKE